MLLGVPVGVVAVAAAFWRGTGIAMSWIAFVIVSSQVLLLSLLLSMELGPTLPAAAVLGLVLLGLLGVYRLRNPVPQYAVAGAWEVRRRSAAYRAGESGNPFAEFAEPGADPPSPAAGPVGEDSLIGRWQFYCDATCRTVVLQFRDDGTFAQTVMDNRGDIVHHPGGTWRLDGSSVEVTGYVPAGQETGQSLTWSLVDTSAGVRLFGGDPGAFFVMTRRSGEA